MIGAWKRQGAGVGLHRRWGTGVCARRGGCGASAGARRRRPTGTDEEVDPGGTSEVWARAARSDEAHGRGLGHCAHG
jgi:hypothetical protein